MTKNELIEALDKAWEDNKYSPEAIYEEVYKATDEYMRSNNDWSLESFFEEYMTSEDVDYAIRDRLTSGGHEAVWFLLSSIKEPESVYKMNVYGYLENITTGDMYLLIEDIKERLKDKEDKEQKNEL